MATRIEAITAYRPRIDLQEAVPTQRFMELMTQRTTLSPGVVRNVQETEVETLIGLLLEGRPVHTGTAIYTPNLDLDGDLEIKVKVDARMLHALNADGAFHGAIINRENIGKSAEELVDLWNAEHQENPVA